MTVVFVLVLAAAAAASAAQAPTAKERSEIAFVAGAFPSIGRKPTGKVTSVRVSSADARWAEARFTVRDPYRDLIGSRGAILERSCAWAVDYPAGPLSAARCRRRCAARGPAARRLLSHLRRWSEHYATTVTSVPMLTYGKIFPAVGIGASTQPRLCGQP